MGVMSAPDPLAAMLYRADPRTLGWPSWEDLAVIPQLRHDWLFMAGAARAFLAERVTREKVRELAQHAPCKHRDPRVGPCYGCVADALLALLRREMGGA